ncbi:short chain dehydrogenase [Microbacterium sp. NPDC055903]
MPETAAKRILVIGASGVIGGAVADALEDAGHEVIRASRSSAESVDIRDAASVAALIERTAPLDGVVVAAGKVPFKPLDELTQDDYRAGLDDKALTQIAVADAAVAGLEDGGSITLTTGVLARRPVPTGAAASVANAALHGYILAAAEHLPRGIRINAVSPNVLAESPGYHASFPGFTPVPVAKVARAYLDVIDGDRNGEIIDV